MKATATCVLIFALACSSKFQLIGQDKAPPEQQRQLSVTRESGLALDQVIKIALDNKIPLGAVIVNNHLCTQMLTIDIKPTTINRIIEEFNRQIRGYSLSINNRAMAVNPNSSGNAVSKLLDLTIPYFRPEETTMRGLNTYLWVYIRAAIDPKQATVTSVISNPDEKNVVGFKVDTSSNVRSILNMIVQTNDGGAWFLRPNTSDWNSLLESDPIKIYSYSEDANRILEEKCK